MNRVTGVVSTKQMLIVSLVGVGILALAVFAAQVILTAESPLGLEEQPAPVEELAPAEVSASVAQPAPEVESAPGDA